MIEIRSYFGLIHKTAVEGLYNLRANLSNEPNAPVLLGADLSFVQALRSLISPLVRPLPYPEWVFACLAIRGDHIYRQHKDMILRDWNMLQSFNDGELDFRVGLRAAYGCALVCVTRNFARLRPDQVSTWLDASHSLWKALAQCSIDRLTEMYGSLRDLETQSLLLDAIIERSRLIKENSPMYTTLSALLLESNSIEGKCHITPNPVARETADLFQNILTNRDVEEEYKKLYARLYDPASFQDAYAAARGCRLMSVPGLLPFWDLYGVTLQGGVIYVDQLKEKSKELSTRYQLCILLHEFAHLLLRVNKTRWNSFHQVATPAQAASPVKRPSEGTSKTPKKQRKQKEAESAPKEVSTLEGLHQLSPPLVQAPQSAAEAMQTIVAHVNEVFSCRDRAEAGYDIEAAIFGKRLTFLCVSSARVLIKWANHSYKLRQFTVKFNQKNTTANLAQEESTTMRRTEDLTSSVDFVLVRGMCGVTSSAK